MSPYDGVKFSKDGSKCKMKRTPIKKKAIDISLLVDCWLCLWRHCRRHVLFSNITDRKDGTRWWIWHGRIREWWRQWESLDDFVNFLESTLSRNFVLKRWLLLCHFIQLHRARDCEETWGFWGCFDASFWPWYMKIWSSAITWIAARTIQHGRECVGANYAVTGRASNTKIAWCLDNTII